MTSIACPQPSRALLRRTVPSRPFLPPAHAPEVIPARYPLGSRSATADFQSVRADLPGLLAPLSPITPHWDPLSRIWNYIFMLPGGMVVNLLFTDQPHVADPPWSPSAETLQDIDTHFWDWSFWLVSKRLKGEDALVESELRKMFGFLLGPMGCGSPPATVEEAWGVYSALCAELARRFGVVIDETLERETRVTLERHGVFVPSATAPPARGG